MKLIIYLPKMTGFDIEVDGQTLHSKYSNITMDVQLNEGKHVVSTLDQAPTPTFWNKIIGFFNPFNQSVNNYSSSYEFELAKDNNVQISIEYGNYDCVEFIFDE